MNRPAAVAAFFVSVAAFIFIAIKLFSGSAPAAGEPIMVFCAAGIRQPVEAAVKAYGREVQLQFGGSNTLLASAEVSGKGDLFIAADDSYLKMARDKGMAREAIPVARQSPVLAVAKGNPKKIASVADLLRPEVKVCQSNPDAAAVGKIVRDALKKTGQWEPLEKKTLVFKPTVNEVANDLKLGTADAGFVWDATVKQYPELERLDLPELRGVTAQVWVIVLKSSTDPTAALRFARFLAASDQGGAEFVKAGFEAVRGDAWSEKPAVLLYSGAMLRPAIEKTITAFERREGCEITRVYNGCGILVAQMKAGARPDMYFACDMPFMKDVKDYFGPPVDISLNQLVILVAKGNPHAVKSLKDLAKPGLKIGIGHEQQCALGVITQETLRQTKLQEAVMKNVAVQTPTGDMLVNQMRTGSLDAVVVYISNGVSCADILEPVAVDIPCALAVQPVAVGRDSKQSQIAERLIEALKSPESRKVFENEGFRWKASER